MRGGRRFADKNMRQQMNRKRIPISQERNTLQCATPAGSSGDNGSVFFSRVHPAAECAMAEILVSDLCECRPPLLIGGHFRSHEGARDCSFRVLRERCSLYTCPCIFPVLYRESCLGVHPQDETRKQGRGLRPQTRRRRGEWFWQNKANRKNRAASARKHGRRCDCPSFERSAATWRQLCEMI